MIFMRQLIKHGTRQKVSLFTCVPGKWLPINKWVRKKKPLNQQLSEVEQQAPVHLTDHAKEETLIQQHNLILDKITEHYRQLSKKHWATEGDRNTKFFQQACTRIRQKNRILFTSSIPRLDFNFNYEGTMTNDFTNSVPSVDECLQILKSMRLNAAPGPDGFNVAFYRAA
jgi:hypothetical protein